ncbi:branched-chain amino acid transaminase [Anoxybacteroides tepidamans]|uniref:branched-chain amino acid transaminase n=1 Tax=Anoxybacteroides tepidamans TaxID=265948 RepID=UPI000554AA0F|nr:branched-chain amino acid transaminase [Anoxybacillus tepidamans]
MGYIFDQGQFVDESNAVISVRNKAFNYGLGCLEGIRAFWNEEHHQLYVFRLLDHYQRFFQSGKSLHIDIPYSPLQLAQWTIQLLRLNAVREDTYIRPICFKGANTLHPDLTNSYNRVIIYCAKTAFIPNKALKVCITSWERIASNMIPPQTKSTGGYLNSALASAEANLNGFDEAIFLTAEGNVSEGAKENIFIVKNNQLITPPVSDDIVAGITRNTVMVLAKNILRIPVKEQSISRVELYSADEVFFTGTAIGVKAVVEIDRRTIGFGQEGPITKQIRNLYNQIVRGNHPDYLSYCTPVYEL